MVKEGHRLNCDLMLDPIVPALATNCILIGHCSKADCVWTRDDFLTICELLLNGNAPTDFMLVYRDKENRPRFAKSKKSKAERRATWAWTRSLVAPRAKWESDFIQQIPKERPVGEQWTSTLMTVTRFALGDSQ